MNIMSYEEIKGEAKKLKKESFKPNLKVIEGVCFPDIY